MQSYAIYIVLYIYNQKTIFITSLSRVLLSYLFGGLWYFIYSYPRCDDHPGIIAHQPISYKMTMFSGDEGRPVWQVSATCILVEQDLALVPTASKSANSSMENLSLVIDPLLFQCI